MLVTGVCQTVSGHGSIVLRPCLIAVLNLTIAVQKLVSIIRRVFMWSLENKNSKQERPANGKPGLSCLSNLISGTW